MTSMQNARWRAEWDWIEGPEGVRVFSYEEMKKIGKSQHDYLKWLGKDEKKGMESWTKIIRLERGQTWTYFDMSGKTTWRRIT